MGSWFSDKNALLLDAWFETSSSNEWLLNICSSSGYGNGNLRMVVAIIWTSNHGDIWHKFQQGPVSSDNVQRLVCKNSNSVALSMQLLLLHRSSVAPFTNMV